jgi:hypothetical protein
MLQLPLQDNLATSFNVLKVGAPALAEAMLRYN